MFGWLPFLAVAACAGGVFAGNWVGEQAPRQRGVLSFVLGAMIFVLVFTGGAIPAGGIAELANTDQGELAFRFSVFVMAIAALSGASCALRFEGQREQIVSSVLSTVIGLPVLIWFSAMMGVARVMVA